MFILFFSLPSWMQWWIPVILGSGNVYVFGPGCPLYKRTPSDSRRRGRRAANSSQAADDSIAAWVSSLCYKDHVWTLQKKVSQHNVVCHSFGELLMRMYNSLHCYDAHDDRNVQWTLCFVLFGYFSRIEVMVYKVVIVFINGECGAPSIPFLFSFIVFPCLSLLLPNRQSRDS